MSTFTVIGLRDDNGHVFVEYVDAATSYEALQIVASEVESKETLCLMGAIEGRVKLQLPGEDNGFAAYASDLATADNGELLPRIHHDVHGWYIVEEDEEEPEDGYSLGFDGRQHYTTREAALLSWEARNHD